jgi:glycosyltransferase 2 family protein
VTKLLRIASIVVVALLLYLFVREIEWDKLGHALRTAAIMPLLLSTVLYFACLFGKALSWKIMLEPNYTVSMPRIFRYTIAAFAASALTPARAGEALRVWALKKRDGVAIADSTAVAIAEKLLDAITLLIVCAPVSWLLPGLPEWVGYAMLVCGSLVFGVLIALVLAVRHVELRERSSWFARLIAGMHVVRDPKRMALAIVTLVLTWTADLIAVTLVLHAVGIEIPISGAMFILFTFNLAVAVPSTPGQIGTLQVGALAATSILGIPEEPALAFALLYQAMQLVPLLMVAFILELDLVRGRISRTRDAAEPVPAS